MFLKMRHDKMCCLDHPIVHSSDWSYLHSPVRTQDYAAKMVRWINPMNQFNNFFVFAKDYSHMKNHI